MRALRAASTLRWPSASSAISNTGASRFSAAILALYRAQLSDLATCVGHFDMHGRQDRKTYSLFFASNHPRGIEKMKEAM